MLDRDRSTMQTCYVEDASPVYMMHGRVVMMIGRSPALVRAFARCYRLVTEDIVFVQERRRNVEQCEAALSAKER